MSTGWKIVIGAGVLFIVYLIISAIVNFFNAHPLLAGFISGLLIGIILTGSLFKFESKIF